MNEIEIRAPERAHHEVVKVVRMEDYEEFLHPDGNRRVEYLYMDDMVGWEGPGDGEGDPHVFYVDYIEWPYVAYFSDGSCGVIHQDGLDGALDALGAWRI